MNALKFSRPFKNAFCRSSRGNEAHFFQDVSNDSRASLRRLLLFQQPVSALLALLIFAEVGRADPLDTWTWRNPFPPAVNLSAVAYGNGEFVAVGFGGTILTSTDGVSWVQRQSGTQNYLKGVAYGNGQYVAVGDSDVFLTPGTILTSVDGVNWAQHQSGTTHGLSGIAYGNGPVVAVGGALAPVASAAGVDRGLHAALQ